MPSYTCCTQLFGYFSVETSWSRRDMRLGTIFRSKSTTSASNGRGGILRPPRPRLSLQTPASDRVKLIRCSCEWTDFWLKGSFLERNKEDAEKCNLTNKIKGTQSQVSQSRCFDSFDPQIAAEQNYITFIFNDKTLRIQSVQYKTSQMMISDITACFSSWPDLMFQ